MADYSSPATDIHTNKLLVLATQAIANVVKSSFGPSGLDKMMVDDIGVRAMPHQSLFPLLTLYCRTLQLQTTELPFYLY